MHTLSGFKRSRQGNPSQKPKGKEAPSLSHKLSSQNEWNLGASLASLPISCPSHAQNKRGKPNQTSPPTQEKKQTRGHCELAKGKKRQRRERKEAPPPQKPPNPTAIGSPCSPRTEHAAARIELGEEQCAPESSMRSSSRSSPCSSRWCSATSWSGASGGRRRRRGRGAASHGARADRFQSGGGTSGYGAGGAGGRRRRS